MRLGLGVLLFLDVGLLGGFSGGGLFLLLFLLLLLAFLLGLLGLLLLPLGFVGATLIFFLGFLLRGFLGLIGARLRRRLFGLRIGRRRRRGHISRIDDHALDDLGLFDLAAALRTRQQEHHKQRVDREREQEMVQLDGVHPRLGFRLFCPLAFGASVTKPIFFAPAVCSSDMPLATRS